MTTLYRYPPQSVSVSVPPLEFQLNGVDTTVSRDTVTPANSRPLPVIQLDAAGTPATPLTDTQLRATPVPVSGPLTDVQLRATAVPVSGPLTDTQIRATALPVSGPLTDTQLRATPVPVSGTVTANTGLSQPLTDTQLRATPVPISGTVTANTGLSQPLTDTQLRATAVPVSGPLTDAQIRATALPVSGPLTDTQLRAAAVPVSLAAAAPEAVRVASYQEIAALTTVQTITAPANVKWFKIMNIGAENIRMRMGGVAVTASTGMRLESGRSEDFQVSGDISVISESGISTSVAVIFGV